MAAFRPIEKNIFLMTHGFNEKTTAKKSTHRNRTAENLADKMLLLFFMRYTVTPLKFVPISNT